MNLAIDDCVAIEGVEEWGVGTVLEKKEGDKYKIFFIHAGVKIIDASIARIVHAQAGQHEKLFFNQLSLNDAGEKSFRSVASLISNFIDRYPLGFEDAKYLSDEREYKKKASNYLLDKLSREKSAQYIEEGRFAEICKFAKSTISKTNLIFPNEIMSLNDGLATESHQELFAKALVNLMYGDVGFRERFEFFVETLQEINACKWTTATYFPFLSQPSIYPYMKPKVVQDAASVFCFEINYHSVPNWKTYNCLMDFVKYVEASLSERGDNMKPRDLIDIQSFIWRVGSDK